MTEKPYQTDLMIAVREQIQANPEQHDQTHWARKTECGTTYCIAGWAVQLAGGKIHWYKWQDFSGYTENAYGEADRLISGAAQDHLGLTDDEARRLFRQCDEGKALDLLDRMIEAGKNGERVQP